MTRWFNLHSTRARLSIWLLIVLTPPLAVTLWLERQWRQHEQTDTSNYAAQWATLVAHRHGRVIDESRQWLHGLSATLAQLPQDPAVLRTVLEGIVEMEPHYVNVGVADRDGKIVMSGRPTTATLVQENGWFRRALQGKGFVVGDYELDSVTGRSNVTVGFPETDGSGNVTRVLFGIIEVDWVGEITRDEHLPPGTEVALIDGTGRILLHAPHPQDWMGRKAPQPLLASLGRPTSQALEARSDEGVNRLYGLKAVTPNVGDLHVAVGIPKEIATQEAESLLKFMVLGFALSLVFAVAVGAAGTELYFLRPLSRIVNTANRLKRGDLAARTGFAHNGDEITELGVVVDQMAEQVERRQRENLEQRHSLEFEKRRYYALVENSADGVILVNDSEKISYASPSTGRILGFPPEEIIGSDPFNLVHPEDRERLRRGFAEVGRAPRAYKAGSFRLMHKNGSWRCVGLVASNMLDEPSVKAIVVNYRDITDRRRAEDALRQAHEQLEERVQERTAALVSANVALEAQMSERIRVERALRKLSLAIEQTADCVMITDAKGIIEYVNPAYEALTGYSRWEAVGAKTSLVRSGKHSDSFYEAMWQRIETGEVFSSVFINRKKDGQIFYQDQTITPIRDANGAVTHFVSTGRDITHRRRTEEALRRLNEQLEHEAKRIASALHDEAGSFLTTAHITLADVARELPADKADRLGEVRKNLDQVEEQLRRLSHELRPRMLDDLGLVDALKFLADGVSLRTGVTVGIQASVEGRYPPLVETALYRMVQEALTNISKHACATKATVVLEEEDQKVLCSIRDDGRGFDFSTLSGGRGLGLIGIQDRLEAVGGRLEIVSVRGGGTELRTTIPLEVS
jgi:PAS domain S-box-containing protein